MLSKTSIEELQIIFREEFGRDLSFAQASTIAKDLVGFYDTLARIAHKDKKIKLASRPSSHFSPSFSGNSDKERD